MKRNLSVLLLLLTAAFAYTALEGRSRIFLSPMPDKETSSLIAIPAPEFSFKDMQGRNHSLVDFRGKAVVLNFWASWCAPCVIEFPKMLKLATATKDESIFIFLSVDESADDIKRFLAKHGKDMPQKNVFLGQDVQKEISQRAYQTYKLPETYLIDAKGMVREKIIGADVEWNSPAMAEKITGFSKP